MNLAIGLPLATASWRRISRLTNFHLVQLFSQGLNTYWKAVHEIDGAYILLRSRLVAHGLCCATGRHLPQSARYMTLTHSVNVAWADSSGDTPAHNGLTDFGKQVVAEMNRLGMMVDISHVSDKTFYDVLAISQAPVIATHSSCRALCDAPRNMTEQMIRDLAAKGGVIQINYFDAFLSQPFKEALSANDSRIDKEIDAKAKERCGEDDACSGLEASRLVHEYTVAGKLPPVDWTLIVEHIDHAVKLVGADHVGLGSDFDGCTTPDGMEDASHLPQITDALLKKGYSPRDIRNILGANTLRVMKQAEATAKRMSQHLDSDRKGSR